MFDHSMYIVDESIEPAQPVLVLSNPSSIAFNVTVTSTDGSATGEYCSILIKYTYNGNTNMLQEVMIMAQDHTLSHFLLERQLFHLIFQ